MGKATTSDEQDDDIPFENAIEELEQIVHAMESERLPLDKLVDSYERGHRLLKACQSRIDEAEQRIERIATNVSSGQVELQPFEAKAEPETPPPPAPAAAGPAQPARKPKKQAAQRDDDDEIRLF